MAQSATARESLVRQLTAGGVRPTPQRELVLRTILAKRDHPTADEIYARAKARMPTISLATVYNCLDSLVSGGLVRSVNFERGPTRYCPNLHPHAHFHDEITGSTHDIDLPPGLLDQVKTVLPPGYAASSVEIIFRGSAHSPRPELAEGRSKTTDPRAN